MEGGDAVIYAYGLFWDANEVDWFPGQGTPFRMLGRIGQNRGTLRVIDARHQKGIYILYGDYGPHYVGLVRGQLLGNRLRQHRSDAHADKWNRFSWFGFRRVLGGADEHGFKNLANVPEAQNVAPATVIRDIEAVLIKAMGLSNINKMNIGRAKEWKQIRSTEEKSYMDRLRN